MARQIALIWILSLALSAQPSRPEMFGYAGGVRAAGDEGSLGSGVMWGGGVLLPLGSRLGVDVDAATGKTSRDLGGGDFQLRRTFVGVSFVGRWGNERTYFFGGGGLGLERSTSVTTAGNFVPGFRPPGSEELAPGVFRVRSSDLKPSLVGRTGIVHTMWRQALVRVDMLWSQQHALPNIGVRAGIGYRF